MGTIHVAIAVMIYYGSEKYVEIEKYPVKGGIYPVKNISERCDSI